MFLHLGNNISVRISEIIGIYDSAIFQEGDNLLLLKGLEAKKQLEGTGSGADIKSLVFTDRKVYPSVISSVTLKRRVGILQNGKLLRMAADGIIEGKEK